MRFLLFSLCLLFAMVAQAQRQKDVVYLKNGSIIKGAVLEVIPNGTIKIETEDGSLFVYNLMEVEKITKEIVERGEAHRERRGRRAGEPFQQQTIVPSPKGYFMLAKVGPLVRPLSGDGIDLSASFINGIHLMEYVSVGVGVDVASITYNDDDISTLTILPVYLDTRFYIPKKRINPMFHFQVGYGTIVDKSGVNQYSNSVLKEMPEKGTGGFYVAFGAGMRIIITQRIAILAEGGLMSQNVKGFVMSNGNSYNQSQSLTALRFNMGVCFSFGKQSNAE